MGNGFNFSFVPVLIYSVTLLQKDKKKPKYFPGRGRQFSLTQPWKSKRNKLVSYAKTY